VQIGRLPELGKDLEILLLRQQLDVLERRLDKPVWDLLNGEGAPLGHAPIFMMQPTQYWTVRDGDVPIAWAELSGLRFPSAGSAPLPGVDQRSRLQEQSLR
jgi:hypothetical protein